ncbi:hypothetical protein ACJX0J_009044, partial [Zea mays]
MLLVDNNRAVLARRIFHQRKLLTVYWSSNYYYFTRIELAQSVGLLNHAGQAYHFFVELGWDYIIFFLNSLSGGLVYYYYFHIFRTPEPEVLWRIGPPEPEVLWRIGPSSTTGSF